MNPLFTRNVPDTPTIDDIPRQSFIAREDVMRILHDNGHDASQLLVTVCELSAYLRNLWAAGAALSSDSEIACCGMNDSEHVGIPLGGSLRMIRELGTGGFGGVHLARSSTGVLVAVKQLDLLEMCAAQQSHSAGREARLLRAVSSPFLVRLLGTAHSPDSRFLYQMQEPILGGSLLSLMRTARGARGLAGGFRLRESRFYCACILLSVHALHSVGVAYRDLKPDNVMVRGRGRYEGYPVLVDMGFARSICAGASGSTVTPPPLHSPRLDALAAALAGQECCTCPCMEAAGTGAAVFPSHVHTYHSVAQSAVHLARCVNAIRSGVGGEGAVPQAVRSRALSVVGPVHALPPEIAPGGLPGLGHGLSADVWCFGVLACEILCGVSPVTGRRVSGTVDEEEEEENSMLLAQRAARGAFALPPSLSCWPAALSFLRACLTAHPSDRPRCEELMRHDMFTQSVSGEGVEGQGEGQGGCDVCTCPPASPGTCWVCWTGNEAGWAALREGTVKAPPVGQEWHTQQQHEEANEGEQNVIQFAGGEQAAPVHDPLDLLLEYEYGVYGPIGRSITGNKERSFASLRGSIANEL